jgi:hypothetical protein
MVRLVSRMCAGRPFATNAAVVALGAVARLADRAQITTIGNAACSLIYNLRFYDGIARGLGGRNKLLSLLRQPLVDEHAHPEPHREPTGTRTR